jgi:hypothetical protein
MSATTSTYGMVERPVGPASLDPIAERDYAAVVDRWRWIDRVVLAAAAITILASAATGRLVTAGAAVGVAVVIAHRRGWLRRPRGRS